MTLGNYIKIKRLEAGLKSKASFAKHVGISATYAGELEKGIAMPSVGMIYRISKALKLNTEETQKLFDLAGYDDNFLDNSEDKKITVEIKISVKDFEKFIKRAIMEAIKESKLG